VAAAVTLQDLIDEMLALPPSARSATVVVTDGEFDFQPTQVTYERGEVTVECGELAPPEGL
jgi:hypothetical protein